MEQIKQESQQDIMPAADSVQPESFAPQDQPVATGMRTQFGEVSPENIPRSENRLIRGVLWIFSGLIILFIAVIVNMILRLVLGSNPIVSFISWPLGIAGVILLIVGPIKGVLILVKK